MRGDEKAALREHAKRLAMAAPPVTPAQRGRLAAVLLRPTSGPGGRAA